MQATVLEEEAPWRRRLLMGALLISGLLHVALGAAVSRIPDGTSAAPEWIEMVFETVEAPPPSEPEAAAEPPPEVEVVVPDEPEVVEYEDPPEVEPVRQPEPQPVPRVVQGLTANSFVQGSGTGLDVRAGTTTAARATDATMDLDDATASAIVPFSSVTRAPKVRYKPPIDVPASVVAARLSGRVELVLTVGAEGEVLGIEVVEPLSPDADAACLAAVRRSRWRPGTRGDEVVIVKGVPYSCLFEETLN